MRRLLPLLACLMLVLTGWGSVVNAAEAVTCVEAPRMTAAMVMPGDCGEMPADADRGYPHHHAACHGHHVAAPSETVVTATPTGHRAEFVRIRAISKVAHPGDTALRPPQA